MIIKIWELLHSRKAQSVNRFFEPRPRPLVVLQRPLCGLVAAHVPSSWKKQSMRRDRIKITLNYSSPCSLAVGFCDPLKWYLGVSRSGSLWYNWIVWMLTFSPFLALRQWDRLFRTASPNDCRGCRCRVASQRFGIQGPFRPYCPSIPYSDLLNLLP